MNGMKKPLRGTRFNRKEVMEKSKTALMAIPTIEFQKCFESWIKRWHKCVTVDTLKGTISFLINKTCILNFLNSGNFLIKVVFIWQIINYSLLTRRYSYLLTLNNFIVIQSISSTSGQRYLPKRTFPFSKLILSIIIFYVSRRTCFSSKIYRPIIIFHVRSDTSPLNIKRLKKTYQDNKDKII